MLDLKFIRENAQAVQENSKNRGVEADVGLVVELADRRSTLMDRIKMHEVYEAVVAGSHKLHGAIGLTREYDLSLYSRRALSSSLGAMSCSDDVSALVADLTL